MSNQSLAESIQQLISADKIHLPIHPSIVRQVLQRSEALESTEQINNLAGRDPALVCNLFRAANSSFFMGLNQTGTLDDAITRLGNERAYQVLARACRENAQLAPGTLIPRYLPPLWQHSVGCAIGARWLAERCGYQALAEQAYLAGLLHDIGKLFLLACLEELAGREHFDTPLSDQIVHEVMETMHIDQGLRLAGEWNLPELFFTVIKGHHATTQDNQNITLALVKLANKGCRKIGLGWQQDRTLVLPTTAEAQFLGISEIALAEYEIMLEDRFFDGTPARPGRGGKDKSANIVSAAT